MFNTLDSGISTQITLFVAFEISRWISRAQILMHMFVPFIGRSHKEWRLRILNSICHKAMGTLNRLVPLSLGWKPSANLSRVFTWRTAAVDSWGIWLSLVGTLGKQFQLREWACFSEYKPTNWLIFRAYLGNQQFTTSKLVFVNCKTAVQVHWDWAWSMQAVYLRGAHWSGLIGWTD